MPCATVTGVGHNGYCGSQEEYMYAVADALSIEYDAIIDADFPLQVDNPFLPHVYMDMSQSEKECLAKANMFIETVNLSIRGFAVEETRCHTCYGVNQGPRVHEPDLREEVKLPDSKLVAPGVITHASSVMEHPEYMTERIVRLADRCGRENVLTSTDCRFFSQATYRTQVKNRVVRAKPRSLAKGARIASERLWSNVRTGKRQAP